MKFIAQRIPELEAQTPEKIKNVYSRKFSLVHFFWNSTAWSSSWKLPLKTIKNPSSKMKRGSRKFCKNYKSAKVL
jgi:hypothetical protein